MKDIFILGAGGHGKVVYDICRSADRPVAGFFDPNISPHTKIHDLEVLGGDEFLKDRSFINSAEFLIGTGLPKINSKIYENLSKSGGVLAEAVAHKSATVSDTVQIGRGTIINAGAVVNIDTVIGENCILNTSCSIDHDTKIGDCCQVNPGAVLAGGVTLHDNAYISSGAIILPGVTIGEAAKIGAGAVIFEDVAAGVTVNGPKNS